MKLVCHSRTKSRKRELAVLFSTHRAILCSLYFHQFTAVLPSTQRASFKSVHVVSSAGYALLCSLCSIEITVLSVLASAHSRLSSAQRAHLLAVLSSTIRALLNSLCSSAITTDFVFYSLVSQDSSALQRRRSRWLDQIWAASSTIGVRRLLAPRLLEHTLEVTRHETLSRHTWGHFCILNTSISRVILCFCPNLYNDKAN